MSNIMSMVRICPKCSGTELGARWMEYRQQIKWWCTRCDYVWYCRGDDDER